MKLVVLFLVLFQTSFVFALNIPSKIKEKKEPKSYFQVYYEARWNYKTKTSKKDYFAFPLVNYFKDWDKRREIIYFKGAELRGYLVKVIDGRLYDYYNVPLNTDAITHFIFYMDRVGNIYGSYENIKKKSSNKIRHSSFGRKAASSGIFHVRDGQLTHVVNDSGHFKIKFHMFVQIMDELAKRKCKFNETVIYDFDEPAIEIVVTTVDNKVKVRDLVWEVSLQKSA